jgi:CheY-like chemotaxis protein
MPRILIVDDDTAIREILREALEDEGYEVAEASDGIEGLAYLRSSQERLVVLLDQLMPRLNGVGVLKAVQADPLLVKRHAYILLSARRRVSMPVVEMAKSLPISLMQKPFDLEPLLRAIAQAARRLQESEE